MKQTHELYVLRDPRDGCTRYFGITKLGLDLRLRAHIVDAKGKSLSHKSKWIRKLQRLDLQPTIARLLTLPSRADACCAERLFIAAFRSLGFRLVNCTAGGDGGEMTPSARKRMSKSAIARCKNPAAVARMTQAWHDAYCNGNLQARMSAGQLRRYRDKEQREKQSTAMRKAYSYPTKRARMARAVRRAMGRPEVRAKLSKAARRRFRNDPTAGARLSESGCRATRGVHRA